MTSRTRASATLTQEPARQFRQLPLCGGFTQYTPAQSARLLHFQLMRFTIARELNAPWWFLGGTTMRKPATRLFIRSPPGNDFQRLARYYSGVPKSWPSDPLSDFGHLRLITLRWQHRLS